MNILFDIAIFKFAKDEAHWEYQKMEWLKVGKNYTASCPTY